MRTITIIFALLLAATSIAQRHYDFEAALQLVSPNSGIIISENGHYYRLEFDADIQKGKFICNVAKTELPKTTVEALYNNVNNVSSKDIADNYDFGELHTTRLRLTRTEDNDRYELFEVSQDYLVLYKYVDVKYCNFEDYLPFFTVHFGNKKALLVTFKEEESCIIALKDKFKIVTFGENVTEVAYKKSQTVSNEELYVLSGRLDTNDLYTVDTLAGKKLTVKNVFGNPMFPKVYDSIEMDKITRCYSPEGLDLYNQQFKKLNTKKVKAFQIHRGFIEIIQGNTLSVLGFDGKEKKKPPFYGYISMDDNFSTNYTVAINKSDRRFRFSASTFEGDTLSVSMIHTEDIDRFYFKNNSSTANHEDSNDLRVPIITRVIGNSFNAIPVYYKRKNGTYGIGNLGNFLDTSYEPERYYEEFQNATKIEFSNGLLLVRKNNLSYYNFGDKSVWYKSLETFKGSFARYRTLNGGKGWLDRTGHEYPDE